MDTTDTPLPRAAPAGPALAGQRGTGRRLDPGWVGWSGVVAHPRSPAGGGGPGRFIAAGPAGAAERRGGGGAPVFAPAAAEEATADAPRPANPPPATNARSLGSVKTRQDDLYDVDVTARVAADGKTTDANTDALTSVSPTPGTSGPNYDLDEKGTKIAKFTSKWTWKGTITIQTVYGPAARASDLSCYGRGTTTADVQSRDITLGFHESCHQADYAAHLTDASKLPELPKLRVGMTEKELKDELDRWTRELAAYAKTMHDDSHQRTDEVGHTLATVESTGQCYVHELP